MGKSYQADGKCESAVPYFKTVASLSRAAYGAEAEFQIADCQFQQNHLKEAENNLIPPTEQKPEPIIFVLDDMSKDIFKRVYAGDTTNEIEKDTAYGYDNINTQIQYWMNLELSNLTH